MILYMNPEKERSLIDYIPLPSLHGLSLDELKELSENINDTMATAYIYHSDLLEMALYSDSNKVDMYIKMRKKQQEKAAAMGNT